MPSDRLDVNDEIEQSARAADQPSAFRPELRRCVGERVGAQTFAEPRQGPVYA